MTQNLLEISQDKYLSRLNEYKLLAALLGISAIALNVLLLALRTSENHDAFMILNIIITTAFGWAVTAFVGMVIKPMAHLYKLSLRPAECVSVKIERISTETFRIESFDCYEVYTSENIFFLIADGNIKLREGDEASLLVASNIITGVRV